MGVSSEGSMWGTDLFPSSFTWSLAGLSYLGATGLKASFPHWLLARDDHQCLATWASLLGSSQHGSWLPWKWAGKRGYLRWKPKPFCNLILLVMSLLFVFGELELLMRSSSFPRGENYKRVWITGGKVIGSHPNGCLPQSALANSLIHVLLLEKHTHPASKTLPKSHLIIAPAQS